MSYRSDAVRAAIKEWQAHPEGRPALYWRETLDPPNPSYSADWCGGFVLWALKQAGIAKNVPWIVGQGFIAPQNLQRVTHPLPGDIVYVGEPFQHQALLVSYEPTTGMVTSIDGNQPGIKPKVRFVQNGNLEFYSIQPLIAEAERNAPLWPYLLGGAIVAAAAAWVWQHGLPAPVDRTLRRLGA